jgi:methionine synthase / methylenetetrahydrofolate reductase(NADPH)
VIKDYLKNNILITDGAMGTYYAEITGDNLSFCEAANLQKPELIEEIHRSYIKAGAKLLRTNTFSISTINHAITKEKAGDMIREGYRIAKRASDGKDIFIGASIGPINANSEVLEENILEEYKFIADTFIAEGCDIFVFETFSSTDYLKKISEYIKDKNQEAFILTSFAITGDGFTREGTGINNLLKSIKDIKTIDAYGFNCGSGPAHLYKSLKDLDFSGDIISTLPNAGYPEVINERTVYVNNPNYFAERMLDILSLGPKIVGGCCGTTPEHIKKLAQILENNKSKERVHHKKDVLEVKIGEKVSNSFQNKLKEKKFVYAIELDPPFDTDLRKIMQASKSCMDNNIDIITIPDSPMSKVRVDSITMAAKIKRELNIDVMPNICCRDKNINAIRSSLLAAHIEGIRNILAVTGDPVSAEDRQEIKNVFNINSTKLMEMMTAMNQEVFKDDTFSFGGALNLNVVNKNIEVERMFKKAGKGATFFLTQPIYEEETIDFLRNFKDRGDARILGGIMPLVSYKNAEFLNNELPGVTIPEKYINSFKINMTREEGEKVGIEIALNIINEIKGYVDGLYLITPFNRIDMMIKLVNTIRKEE